MEKRQLSESWRNVVRSELLITFIWVILLLGGYLKDGVRENFTVRSLLVPGGVLLLYLLSSVSSFLHVWRQLWHPVTEEGGRWIFRRRGEILTVDPGNVLKLYPYGYGRAIVLRLKDAAGQYRLVMFQPSASYKTEMGRSVEEMMSEEIASARKARFSEERQNPQNVTPPKATKARRISSRYTEWLRLGLPWIGGLLLLAWVVCDWSEMAFNNDWSIARVVIPSLIALIGFIFWQEFLANLISRVDDLGNALRIRYRGKETTVPLEAIERIDYRPLQGIHWIVIHFKDTKSMGGKLVFMPEARHSVEGWNAALDSLEERMEIVDFLAASVDSRSGHRLS